MNIYVVRRSLVDGGESEPFFIAAHNFQDACRVCGPYVSECVPAGKLINADIEGLRDWLSCIEELGENFEVEEGIAHLDPMCGTGGDFRCIFKEGRIADQCAHDALPSSNFCFCHQDRRP